MRDFWKFIGILLIAIILALVVWSYAKAITIKDFSQWECKEYLIYDMPLKYRGIEVRIFVFKRDNCVAMLTTPTGQIICYGYFIRHKLTLFDSNDEELKFNDKLKEVIYYALIPCGLPI